MKVTKRFIVLFILVLVIVPLFNTGGCNITKANAREFHARLKDVYMRRYSHWDWAGRYATLMILDISAEAGEVEDFSWLDLPFITTEITEVTGDPMSGGSGHH